MSRWGQRRQILKQPTYRIKLGFFLLLSITTISVAIVLPPNCLGRDILLEFAVTFGAVGILQLLWDFVGGEPLEARIENILQSTAVLSDLQNGDIGIERIWPDRHTWEEDSEDGRAKWYTRVCQARRIDMVSNTLWDNWIQREKFLKRLFEHIKQDDIVVRILIYDPDSKAFKMRAKDEGQESEMQREIAKTLKKVRDKWNKVPESARRTKRKVRSTIHRVDGLKNNLPEPARTTKLEVGLTHKTLHLAQIIRADDRMLVANYLSGKSGSVSPTMQLRGSDSSYFRKYAKQFRTLWKRAGPLDLNDDRVSQILQKYGDRSNPPPKD